MSTRKRVSGDYTIETVNSTDIVTIETSQVQVKGDLFVTGNISVPANLVADRIVNGTTDIEIPVINGNIAISVAGVSNIAVIHDSGLDVDGTVDVTGNLDAANMTTSGSVSATGNIDAANLNTLGNVWITRDASAAQPTVRFTDTDTTIVDGTVLGAVEWYTSDVTGMPRVTSSIRSRANGVAGNAKVEILTSNDDTSSATVKLTVLHTGQVGIANGSPTTTLGVTGTGYFSSDFESAANVTGGNILSSGLASIAGNITGGNVLSGGLISVAGNITAGNIASLGAIAAGASGISTTGNVTGGNVLSDGIISATGNLTTTDIFATTLSASGNVDSGNLRSSGTLSLVGNVLTNLNVDGTVTAPTVDATVLVVNRIKSDDSSFIEIEDGARVENQLEVAGTSIGNIVQAQVAIQLPVFAANALRDVAITSPQPGMMVFVTDGDGSGNPKTHIYGNATTGWQTVTVA